MMSHLNAFERQNNTGQNYCKLTTSRNCKISHLQNISYHLREICHELEGLILMAF